MITLVLDNLRSAYNVGSILRTAEALGAERVIACGTTPYPRLPEDSRPPHIIAANDRAIAKVALGAERSLPIAYAPETIVCLGALHRAGYLIAALEQTPNAQPLAAFTMPPATSLALVLGPEVTGLSPEVLTRCDVVIEIPQRGTKESLNVSVAAGIALYQLTNQPPPDLSPDLSP